MLNYSSLVFTELPAVFDFRKTLYLFNIDIFQKPHLFVYVLFIMAFEDFDDQWWSFVGYTVSVINVTIASLVNLVTKYVFITGLSSESYLGVYPPLVCPLIMFHHLLYDINVN